MNRIVLFLFFLLAFTAFAPNHSSAQESPEAVRKLITKVAPQYPNLARTMGIRGMVRADVVVAPNGTVKLIEVKGGHPMLVQSAEDALRQWKWEPASHETRIGVELKFGP
jgi:TonB family protein